MFVADQCADFIELLYRSYSVRLHKHTETGEFWICLSDVCKILKITNPSYLSRRISSANKYKHKLQNFNGKIPVVWVDRQGLARLLETLPESKEINDFWLWSRRLFSCKTI